MIKIIGLQKHYKNLALHIDEYEFNSGKIYGIIGVNGSGKSTFLKSILGLIDYSGTIIIDNIDVKKNKMALEPIGAIIETPAFINGLSARQNLEYFLKDNKIAIEFLSQIGMDDYLDDLVRTYSIGMKQKLAFSVACAKGSKVIILDEPFSGMDKYSVKQCLSILKKLKENGVLIIITSHDLDTISKICDEVCFLKKGQLLEFDEDETHDRIVLITCDSLEECNEARRRLISYEINMVDENSFEIKLEKYTNNEEVKEILFGLNYSSKVME